MTERHFLSDDYKASRREEALRVGLDENANWDQIFEKTMFLVCNVARFANIRQLYAHKFGVGSRNGSWDKIMENWELYQLERIRKERAKTLKLPPNTSWEKMAMVKEEGAVRRTRFIKRLNKCRIKCPVTWEQKECLREREARTAGLHINSKWKSIIKERVNQKIEEEIAISVQYLGFSPDAGFAELYDFITTRFADENRKEEAMSLNLKENSRWDEIFKAKALHNLNLRRLKEISLFGLDENTNWEGIILNRYLIELDISREEAARELKLPVHSSWDEIMREDFTIKTEE